MRLIIVSLAAVLLHAQDISPEALRAHVRFLASDLLEGRSPGERGGALATEYLASQLAVAGAKPAAANRSWFQPVRLTGVQTEASSTFEVVSGSRSRQLTWLSEFVGHVQTQQPSESFDAEAVFVGHGITAPEYGWDDYAGADVRGKAVVLFTNEPSSDRDPEFFAGRALTYYGRWTYKYQQALRKGAIAAIIIHTNETAGYGWDVVRSSWGREDSQVTNGGEGLRFAGWVTRDAGEALLRLSGQGVDQLLDQARKPGFRAKPLKLGLRARIRSKIREVETHNVVGRIPGSDPSLTGETVIFTAHWDHLGRDSAASGDGIFNGAVDNATGCAILLEIARAWAALPRKPRRDALFLFTAAEEAGLLGSEFYVAHPLVPLDKTALVLNFDSFLPLGRTTGFVADGAERTTLWPKVQEVAERSGHRLTPNNRPEQGGFFRSDHFPFAKAGVAAFSVGLNGEYVADSETLRSKAAEFSSARYHRPADEYSDEWDFAGLDQAARFGLALGIEAGNLDAPVRWLPPTPARARNGR